MQIASGVFPTLDDECEWELFPIFLFGEQIGTCTDSDHDNDRFSFYDVILNDLGIKFFLGKHIDYFEFELFTGRIYQIHSPAYEEQYDLEIPFDLSVFI